MASNSAIFNGISGVTPLMRAVASNQDDPANILRILNDPKQSRTLFDRDDKGKTALDWARIAKNYIAVRILLKAISSHIQSARIDSIAPVSTLRDVLIQSNSYQGEQLMHAVVQRHPDVAEEIIRQNKLSRAEIEVLGFTFFTDIRSRVGYTPLMLAAGMNMKNVVRELVQLQTPLDAANNFGQTALTIACATGNADIAQFLLTKGADLYHRTAEGRTVLHCTCRYAKAKLVKLLLTHMMERFAQFRVEGHKLVDFDYTRWTTYSSVITDFVNTRDSDGKTCIELLPAALDNKYQLERRLRLSGVTGLNPISRKEVDDRSIASDSAREFDSHAPDFQPGQAVYGDEEDVVDPDVDSLYSEATESTDFSFFQFSHDTDNDVVPPELEEVHSAKTSMPLEKEVEYIRQIIQQVELKVLGWKSNAEKERNLAALISCPLDCGVLCKVEDMTTHVRDLCPLRTVQCSTCHLIVRHVDLAVHHTRLCGRRQIACPNSRLGCGALITPDSRASHLRSQCEYRRSHCRQFCGLVMPWCHRDQHEAEVCKLRVVSCDQCHERMQSAQYTQHIASQCPERQMRCRVGCGAFVAARHLEAHEETECVAPCKWQCGQRIGPRAKLSLHETMHCFNRPAVCRHNCGVHGLTAKTKLVHESVQCGARLVPCSLNCGEVLPASGMHRHQAMFTGTCSRRLVLCPSNLIGWRVQVVEEDIDALVLKYERRALPVDGDSQPSREGRCFGDFIYIRCETGQRWVNVWTTDLILLDKVKDVSPSISGKPHRSTHFACGSFVFCSLGEHLAVSCPHRKVIVTGVVDRATGQMGQVVPLADAVGGTALRLAFDDFAEKEQVNADGSQGLHNVTCSFCAQTVARAEYDHHCQHNCPEFRSFCPFGCGIQLANREVQNHCREVCSKRSVTCMLCSFSDLWAEELEEHRERKCPKRIVSCENNCGVQSLCACDVQHHLESECDLRMVQCPCGLHFTAISLADHQKLNCIHRIVQCPQGCGEQMKQCDVDGHIEFFCRNKTHYYNKSVECSNGCGSVMMRRDLLHHVSFDCPKRIVECSQQCGNSVPLDLLPAHLQVCPLRVVCCEPGMTMCARPLHLWFYKLPAADPTLAVPKRMSANERGSGIQQPPQPATVPHDVQSVLTMDDPDGESSVAELSTSLASEAFTAQHAARLETAALQGQQDYEAHHHQDVMQAHDRLKALYHEQKAQEHEQAGDGSTHEEVAASEDTDFPLIYGGGKKSELFHGKAVTIQLLKQAPADPLLGAAEKTAKKSFFDMLVVSKHKKGAARHKDDASDKSDTSSVYFEGHAMKFREAIRLHFCERHRVHALMAAVRYQEVELLEYLARQVKESADIDEENVHGDNALTLSCRMGLLPFVKILIQHGADINKETFNGRTALIEAVKCTEENIPLIEYLIQEGALVKYKTARHAKTALDWARRYAYGEAQLLQEQAAIRGELIEITKERMRILGRPKTVRLLELAAMVQQQANMMFTKISMGDSKWVLRIIAEGDFFDPNNEVKAYAEMERFAELALDADKQLATVQAKTFGLSNKIDGLQAKRLVVLDEVAAAQRVVDECFSREKALDNSINDEFSRYEKVAMKVKVVDVEEVVRLQVPSDALLVSLYSLGVLFDLFDEDFQFKLRRQLAKSNTESKSDEAAELSLQDVQQLRPQWWPFVRTFLTMNVTESLRRVQTYSRAKIHIDRTQPLFQQVGELVRIFKQLSRSTLRSRARSASATSISSAGSASRSPSPKRSRQKSKRRQSESLASDSLLQEHASGMLSEDSMDFESARRAAVSAASSAPSSPVLSATSRKMSKQTSKRVQLPLEEIPAQLHSNGVQYVDALADARPPELTVTQLQANAQREQASSTAAELDDAEWDSDAEGAATGKWVKGEWVGVVKTRREWWIKEEDLLTPRTRDAQTKAREEEAQKTQWNTAKVLRVTDELVSEETKKTVSDLRARQILVDDDEQQLMLALTAQKEAFEAEATRGGSRSGSRARRRRSTASGSPSPARRQSTLDSPSRGSILESGMSQIADSSPVKSPGKESMRKSRSSRRLRDSLVSGRSASPDPAHSQRHTRRRSAMLGDEVLDYNLLGQEQEEELAGYSLIACMDQLLRAITRYALNYRDVLACKQATLAAIRQVDVLKQRGDSLLEEYQTQFDYRASVEAEYIAAMKKSKFLNDKVQVFKEKVRVARLMNTVSVNGHTPLSWAASYGAFNVVEEMLSRGGHVGYTAQLYHLTGTYLQLSYRIFKIAYDARMRTARQDREKKEAGYEVATLVAGSTSSKADQLALVRTLTMLKDQRAKLLEQIKYLRSRLRFAVPEAVYMGRWEVVHRIYERRLLHFHFCNTWCYPSPPLTLRRRLEFHYEHNQMSLLEVLAYGMNDMSAGIYLPDGGGWVGPNDPKEPFGETYFEVHRILEAVKEKQQAFLAGRRRIRILSNERRNQREGEKAMVAAIRRHDFRCCMSLAQDRGITIDLETEDGQTALIAASEEDPDAMNHAFMINLDGKQCLEVEFLLDRYFYRPAVNLETTTGYTALIRASILGRAFVVSALLDRGAAINYQNRFGRTALHYAASCGHTQVVRILVERLADVTVRDQQGRNAYEIAEQENFVDLMSLLSQFHSGNLGSLQLTRGYVNNQSTCPLGCGAVLFHHEVAGHLETCQLRVVPCPNACSVHVMAREIDAHVQDECPKRIIVCPDCNVDRVVSEDLPVHRHEQCMQRVVHCPLRCGKDMACADVELHVQRHCGHRLVPCPNLCPQLDVAFIDLPAHLESVCVNRRVACPRKCHSTVIFHRLEEHMQSVCSLRPVPCEHCGEDVPFESRERHQTKECPRRPVACPWKCGLQLQSEELARHQAEECPRQSLDCPLQCGKKVFRGVLAKHQADQCALRLVPCPLLCVVIAPATEGRVQHQEPVRVRANVLELHLKYDCACRPVRCTLCQTESVPHQHLAAHQAEQCPKRLVPCRNAGCQKTLAFDLREPHELGQCRFRTVMCPQACGEQVLAIQAARHCARECSMRFVECPLQCQLTRPLRAKEVDCHLEHECPRKHLAQTQSPQSGDKRSKKKLMSSSLPDLKSAL